MGARGIGVGFLMKRVSSWVLKCDRRHAETRKIGNWRSISNPQLHNIRRARAIRGSRKSLHQTGTDRLPW